MKMEFIDIRRAYFHAPARRTVYVKLPPEDHEDGMCGKLNKSVYGTRDAAQNWEHQYANVMSELGFNRGIAVPCLFYHPVKEIRVAIHGDDFTSLGEAVNLDWLQKELKKHFELKVRGRIGPSPKDDKCIRLLNRIFQWTPEGITWEADQRHAEIVVQQLGLDEKTKPVNTTGNKNKEVDEEELESEQATQYRAMTARCNYLSQDRSDIQYAVKELCRSMSRPTVEDWVKLKHLAKYLKDKTRYRTVYRYQGPVNKVTVYTDTDYAGCHKTRKSTSGGILQVG
jgi:hypothetical protein